TASAVRFRATTREGRRKAHLRLFILQPFAAYAARLNQLWPPFWRIVVLCLWPPPLPLPTLGGFPPTFVLPTVPLVVTVAAFVMTTIAPSLSLTVIWIE